LLSLVVIGKNEAEHMPRLAKSVQALIDGCPFPVETIFVDSASTDDSVMHAVTFCDHVIELQPSGQLCASAGRSVGTLEATYPWVLYLDADMELHADFIAAIPSLLERIEEGNCVGYIGTYLHHFDNGSTAVQEFKGEYLKSDWAAHFGGAVLLRLNDVLAAGNWNPAVFGKEEMNLYARLGDGRRVVRCVDVPMVNHHSEFYTRWQMFVRLLYPGGGQGKVFYGFGQSMRALLQARKLPAYLRLESELTIFWALLLLGLIVAANLPWIAGGALLLAEMLMLSLWMGSGAVMRYSCLIIPLVSGWMKYDSAFTPEISRRISRESDIESSTGQN